MDQFLSEAADEVGIESIQTTNLVSSGVTEEKLPFHHVIISTSHTDFHANELLNGPECALYCNSWLQNFGESL